MLAFLFILYALGALQHYIWSVNRFGEKFEMREVGQVFVAVLSLFWPIQALISAIGHLLVKHDQDQNEE